MREHELDQILSGEQDIVASAKFTRSVMDAVKLDASTPPPIPFPWVRSLPGLAAAIFASMWIIIEGFQLYDPRHTTTFVPTSWIERFTPLVAKADSSGVGWILLALAVTAACVELTWRLSARRA